jgi:predicted phage terminase large subunit-like protein
VEVTESDMKEYEKYEVGVDARLSQQGFYQELLRQAVFTVNDKKRAIRLWADKSSRDKKERASGWAARARVGKVRLTRNPQWNEPYMKEVLSFTGDNLGHDDQVDATSGAYEMLWDRPGRKEDGKKLSPEEFERRFLNANRIRR